MAADTLIISDEIYNLIFVKKSTFEIVLEKYMNNTAFIKLKGKMPCCT